MSASKSRTPRPSRRSQLTKSEEKRLRKAPAPTEPRIAYPEPHLSSHPGLSLIRGKTFFAADPMGRLEPAGAPHVGLFLDDTRYLSYLDLRVNGHAPVVLSSTTAEGAFLNRIELTIKGSLKAEGLDLPVNTVYVRREQLLEHHALYDVLHFENFHTLRAKLEIEITCDADFMDIFQVRGILRGKAGQHYQPVASADRLLFVYEGLDGLARSTQVRFDPPPTSVSGKRACWKIDLAPLGRARFATTITAYSGRASALKNGAPGMRAKDGELVGQRALDADLRRLRGEFESWERECTHFTSDNDIFNTLLRTAVQDFYALRIPSGLAMGGGKAIAAGVPWFAAIFGRDSLIASFQTLGLNPSLAEGTLRVLAATQGKRRRDDSDEEPGKIVHEIRSGEMTATGEVAFGKNYGSVDATPLFVVLLHEYFLWSGDMDFLREMKPALLAAVRWLLEYGDLDGDGLIEFQRKSPGGLFNQGWKDSGDANLHSDGRIAQPPTALIEVQGYAVAAYTGAAALLRALAAAGDADEKESKLSPARLAERASQLRRQIQQKFWMAGRKYYAMALDGEKQPLDVVSSNPGHLLFAGAIQPQRAKSVAQQLMSSGLFSGWGIRTLSHHEATYNPMSYHRGSVWPHDNSLIAYGMGLYGFRKESSRLASALFEAAVRFRDYRLPELFCGIERRSHDEPVHYPVSCSPQAWASGAMLLILRSLLGLKAEAGVRQLKIVNPQLPPFLKQLEVKNLLIGRSRVSLEFMHQGDRTFCNLKGIEGEEIAVSVVYR